MSTVRDFTVTLLLLKRGSKESVQLECSPNTAGRNEISQNKNTKDDDVELLFSFAHSVIFLLSFCVALF